MGVKDKGADLMPILLGLLVVLLVTKAFTLNFIVVVSWLGGVLLVGLMIKVAIFFYVRHKLL